MIIIGIDPGTATTGYGIIEAKKNKGKKKNNVVCLKYGVIRTKPGQLPEKRLNRLYTALNKILKEYKPDLLTIESLYFFKNLKTALPVSEARGIVLLGAAKKRIKVKQVSPLQVKADTCGYGRASKQDVQKRIKKIFKLKEIPKPDDAADAMAIALYGFNNFM